jgi:hypothetical protein
MGGCRGAGARRAVRGTRFLAIESLELAIAEDELSLSVAAASDSANA